MSHLRKFLRLPGGERWLLIQAALLLQAISFGTRLLPFRTLRRLLELAQRTHLRLRRTDQAPADRIARAVEAAGRYVPGQKTCLIQALTAQVLLTRRGHPARLQIGVAKDDDRLQAHAWVESEGKVVLGGHGLGHYTPLTALEVKRP